MEQDIAIATTPAPPDLALKRSAGVDVKGEKEKRREGDKKVLKYKICVYFVCINKLKFNHALNVVRFFVV